MEISKDYSSEMNLAVYYHGDGLQGCRPSESQMSRH